MEKWLEKIAADSFQDELEKIAKEYPKTETLQGKPRRKSMLSVDKMRAVLAAKKKEGGSTAVAKTSVKDKKVSKAGF